MFAKILGKTKNNSRDEIVEKISKMNLTEMRTYSKNKVKDFPVSDIGLEEIIKNITKKNEKTSKYYLNSNDMDSKLKKGFDLVLTILADKIITLDIIEEAKKFLDTYEELILEYDKNNKDIYYSRLSKALLTASNNFGIKTDIISNVENRSLIKEKSFIVIN